MPNTFSYNRISTLSQSCTDLHMFNKYSQQQWVEALTLDLVQGYHWCQQHQTLKPVGLSEHGRSTWGHGRQRHFRRRQQQHTKGMS